MSLTKSTCIRLHCLPNSYCTNFHERLANCEDDESLDVMQEELIDRFGFLPEAGEALIACHRLPIAAKPLGIIKVDASDAAIQLQFNVKTDIDSMKLINLLQRDKRCRMNGPDKLRMMIQIGNLAHKTSVVKELLSQFS